VSDGPIRFGTSGWRGVLAEEVTLPRADALAEGVARWLREPGPRGGRPRARAPARVLVAHDTRFLGGALAARARARLAAAGHRAVFAESPVPTPVVAQAVRAGAADAALVFTASHNPPEYQGVKVIAAWGGGVTDAQARRIEAHARRALARGPRRAAPAPADAAPAELVGPYLERLLAWLDRAAFRRAPPIAVYDALHGTGAGVCDRALRALGVRVESLRAERSPRFGGGSPDPTPERLGALIARVRAQRGRALGLATDGDADRYAVVDCDGAPLTETEALALLVDRLARTGRLQRGVAISIATGTLVERVAASHGLAVTRHPIGFKHLARALVAGEADAAGEESGGFAVDALGRDKDGILACALFAEIAAAEGTPLRARLRALARAHGASACARAALRSGPRARERLAALLAAPPERVDGAPVQAVECRDGLRLAFADGFLMLRGSGTEPVLRIYAEAPDRTRLARRLAAGRALLSVDGAGRAD
jgi:phosphoglucomutase